jgi:hypothetical protein
LVEETAAHHQAALAAARVVREVATLAEAGPRLAAGVATVQEIRRAVPVQDPAEQLATQAQAPAEDPVTAAREVRAQEVERTRAPLRRSSTDLRF